MVSVKICLLLAASFLKCLILHAQASHLGKGKDVCTGEGSPSFAVRPKHLIGEEHIGLGKLSLPPVGDLCHEKEITVKPARPAIPKFGASTDIEKEDISFTFPDFPKYPPSSSYPAFLPPQASGSALAGPASAQCTSYTACGGKSVGAPPVQIASASPCNSCAAKLPQVSPVQSASASSSSYNSNAAATSSVQSISSSSCGCAAKAAQPSVPSTAGTNPTLFTPVATVFTNVPADAVSQQLAYRAKEDAKVKMEGEIAFGFKTLPIEIEQRTYQKDRYPEEALFNLNGQVLEFVPEQLVFAKAKDAYRGTEFLMAGKVPTQPKQLTLPELGYGPAVVQPSPYVSVGAAHEALAATRPGVRERKEDGFVFCKDCFEPGEVTVKHRHPVLDNYEVDEFLHKTACKKCKEASFK